MKSPPTRFTPPVNCNAVFASEHNKSLSTTWTTQDLTGNIMSSALTRQKRAHNSVCSPSNFHLQAAHTQMLSIPCPQNALVFLADPHGCGPACKMEVHFLCHHMSGIWIAKKHSIWVVHAEAGMQARLVCKMQACA